MPSGITPVMRTASPIGIRQRVALTLRWSPALLFAALSFSSQAQSIPAATVSPLYTPFSIPTLNGTLNYSLSSSTGQTFGYNGTSQHNFSAGISGNVGFVAPSVLYPFSMVYAGGDSINSNGQFSTFFQTLTLSQGYIRKRWGLNLSDSISYSPQTPSTGLSGIPGVGDVGVSTGTSADQQVLTAYAARVSNSISASVNRSLSGKTTVAAQGSYSILRFLGSASGTDTNSEGTGASLVHHLDARTSVNGAYHFSEFSYVSLPGNFGSQGATLGISRVVSPRLNLTFGAGPERIGGNPANGRVASYSYSASARLQYTGGVSSGVNLGLSYAHSTNAGSGTYAGAQTDTVGLVTTRRLTRSLQPSLQFTYAHTAGLHQQGTPAQTTDTLVVSTQFNRAISQVMSIYGSYSAQHQSYSGSNLGINPFGGFSQTLGFGVTYSPRSIHVGRQ